MFLGTMQKGFAQTRLPCACGTIYPRHTLKRPVMYGPYHSVPVVMETNAYKLKFIRGFLLFLPGNLLLFERGQLCLQLGGTVGLGPIQPVSVPNIP